MTGYKWEWNSGIAAWLAMLFLAGCASSPRVDFYVLSADARPMGNATVAGSCGNQAISVGPISWPRYLDQPRIVTRIGLNQMNMDEFHRWGGSLEDDFSRTLIKNVSSLLQSERVVNYRNSGPFAPVYRVELDVLQFDGQLSGDATLDVKWSIIAEASAKLAMATTSTIHKSTAGPDYAALVNASSMAVSQLSEEIAVQLGQLCAGTQK